MEENRGNVKFEKIRKRRIGKSFGVMRIKRGVGRGGGSKRIRGVEVDRVNVE